MFKINHVVFLILLMSLSSCAQSPNNGRWDFDHEVQFSESEVSPGHYKLSVIQQGDVPFEKLATFLLRRSLILCGEYGYKIEVLKGIEGFDDKRVAPNYIQPDLTAIIECPSNTSNNN